jgi:DNA uptake protein ComE-like DNA-binding protein
VERAALLVAAALWLAALPGPALAPEPGRLAIDLNCAPPALLEALPGVGAARARALAAARPFATLEDVGRVPGIGPASVARLRPVAVLGSCR